MDSRIKLSTQRGMAFLRTLLNLNLFLFYHAIFFCLCALYLHCVVITASGEVYPAFTRDEEKDGKKLKFPAALAREVKSALKFFSLDESMKKENPFRLTCSLQWHFCSIEKEPLFPFMANLCSLCVPEGLHDGEGSNEVLEKGPRSEVDRWMICKMDDRRRSDRDLDFWSGNVMSNFSIKVLRVHPEREENRKAFSSFHLGAGRIGMRKSHSKHGNN